MAKYTWVSIRLGHDQKTQLDTAVERYREAKGEPTSQEQIMKNIIGRFCVEQGVRFAPISKIDRSKN